MDVDASSKTIPDAAAETVSVIVPVYNTAQYLERCVHSITAQSYPRLDILLVDDGSTDGSGMLCDSLAGADQRIRVIHKENGGMSDARNAGIEAAWGEYLLFVDSDDFIAEDMAEKLYDAALRHHAEMSICNFLYVDESGRPLPEENRELPLRDEGISGEEALRKIFTEKGWYYVTACNKLYSRGLFESIRFPKGKIHEDEFTAHRLLGACSRVACIRDVGYYYVQRPGSIVHSRNCRSNLHAAEANLDRAAYLYDRGIFRCAGRAYLIAGIYLSEACADLPASAPQRKEIQALLAQFREGRRFLPYCTRKERLQLLIVSLSPFLYHRLFQNPARRSAKATLHTLLRRN